MPDEEKLVRMMSLQERKEAIVEQLDWIDFQISLVRNNHERQIADLYRRRDQAMRDMREIIREEMKGRSGSG
jgi:hypothetical protein